ncbi:hypothetical protein IMZ48_49770, partial [Candidatus Bathyarchaeota archaeon]|nr:hypothetical protein [Candidatus Bathyarchaeota archaeon]
MEPSNNITPENAEPEADAPEDQPDEEAAEAPPPAPREARMPTKKDTSLREFLGKMDDYAPIVRFPPSHLPPHIPDSATPLTPHPQTTNR